MCACVYMCVCIYIYIYIYKLFCVHGSPENCCDITKENEGQNLEVNFACLGL